MQKKIVIAPDSFKESLSAQHVAEAIARGFESVDSRYRCIQRPIADGGEGTVATVLSSVSGERVTIPAHDPLMRPINASYGLIDGGTTAVIECAAASGLELLAPDDRDPTITTSFGTGELIRDALNRGASRIIIGLGGSATNDAGCGIANALGIRLLDEHGEEIGLGGLALSNLKSFDFEGIHPALKKTSLSVACDVTNPLYGPTGSSLNYSAQKGASPEESQALENALIHFGDQLDAYAGYAVSKLPGAGAAGGIGAGLVAMCGATLEPGFELLAGLVGLEEDIQRCDLVITGEGRIDTQTAQGKAPSGVAKLAKHYGKPVVAFCGTLEQNFDVNTSPFDEVFSIDSLTNDHADAMQHAGAYLAELAATFARRWNSVLD